MSSVTVDLGAVTAYAEAVAGGYTGTRSEFEADLGNSGTNATAAATSASDSEAFGAGTRGGVAVTSGDDAYQNNSKYYSELAATSAASVSPSTADDLAYILGS